jgi:hypothetical protein
LDQREFEMQHRLSGLRGSAYVREFKRLLEELRSPITKDFKQIVESNGKFTPKDLGGLCIKYLLPVTVMDDFLNGYDLLPSGTWDRLREQGCKAKDIGVEWK